MRRRRFAIVVNNGQDQVSGSGVLRGILSPIASDILERGRGRFLWDTVRGSDRLRSPLLDAVFPEEDAGLSGTVDESMLIAEGKFYQLLIRARGGAPVRLAGSAIALTTDPSHRWQDGASLRVEHLKVRASCQLSRRQALPSGYTVYCWYSTSPLSDIRIHHPFTSIASVRMCPLCWCRNSMLTSTTR